MDDKEDLRYRGAATVVQSYMTEFLVVCPKCNKDALVTVENSWLQNGGKLACSNCSHIERVSDRKRYNVVVQRNCDNCGKRFEITVPGSKEKVEQITIPCPHCGVTRTYTPKNEAYYLTYNSPSPRDPVFHLSLWLQADVQGNVLWAFNRQHLSEIKDYVKSRLRERRTPFYTTMVERLPQFIKDAKNRDAIIKAIDKMERKGRS